MVIWGKAWPDNVESVQCFKVKLFTVVKLNVNKLQIVIGYILQFL